MSIASCPIGLVGFDNHSLMVLKALWHHGAFDVLLSDDGDNLRLFNWLFILINVCNRLSSLAIFFNSLNIEVFLGSLLLILWWWCKRSYAEGLFALCAQLWFHFVDRIVNCMIIKVDVIVGLCPNFHHLHFIFTLTLKHLLFSIWVESSNLSGVWREEVLECISFWYNINLRVSSL